MKKNNNLLICSILFCISNAAIANDINEFPVLNKHCLASFDKKFLLEWGSVSVDNEDWDASYIKYGSKNKPINIYLQNIKVIDDEPSGRPLEFSRKYLEIIDGKISGEYVFNTQGVNFVEGYYKNYKTNKVTNLSGDDIFSEGCVWTKH